MGFIGLLHPHTLPHSVLIWTFSSIHATTLGSYLPLPKPLPPLSGFLPPHNYYLLLFFSSHVSTALDTVFIWMLTMFYMTVVRMQNSETKN